MIRLIRTLMLLAVALALVKWSASGAVGPGGGGGAPGVTTLSPGGGLTAMLGSIANDRTLQLGDGTYTVTPSIIQSNFLNGNQYTGVILANKTNLSIIGVPGQTIIDGSTSPGEVMWVTNCSGLYFYGLTFVGWTNHNFMEWPLNSVTLWAGVNVYKCEKVTFENCRFLRHADHGLQDKGSDSTVTASGDPPSTNQMMVLNCYFEDIGSIRTNASGGGSIVSDGTAIVPTGWTMEGNVFRSCLRGIEPYDENDAGGRVFYNTVMRNNQFYNMVDFAIGTAGSSNCHYAVMEGNIAINDRSFSWHGTNYGLGSSITAPTIAYYINAGTGWTVRNNLARGGIQYGFFFGNTQSKLNDFVVTDNTAIDINRGDGISYSFHVGTRANAVADSASISRMLFSGNRVYGGSLAGFIFTGIRDSMVENNVSHNGTAYTSDQIYQSCFYIGQDGNTAANVTNLTFRNNIASTSVGSAYGFTIANNIESLFFENNSLIGTFGFNGGITNKSTNATRILGPARQFAATIDLPSIGVTAQFTTNFTATGATTNDAVEVLRIPAQFYASGNTTNVIWNSWASNDTIYIKFSNNDAVSAADAPSVRMTATVRQIAVHGQ